ncbi:MAG: NfeD family protein [Planctomycetota bacterium]|jgi:membrane-bound serine protease (ClpP class)
MAGTIVLIVVLLLIAMAMIVVEICTPTFGLLGVAAAGCVVWALYLSYSINGVFGLVMTIVMIVCFPIYIVAAVKTIPKTPLGKRLHLGRKRVDSGEGTPEAEALSNLVGRKIKTETVLRPSGMIRIDGMRVVAQAESGLIEKGAEVEIIRATGMNVVVREVES